MVEIRRTDRFIKWLKKLNDKVGKLLIAKRIERLAEGNPGDCRFLGDKVSEMRIDHGPGYRVYFTDTGKEIIILLCGGDKSTQQADIETAKKLAQEEEEYENK
jgi:putative addiction module killer protein